MVRSECWAHFLEQSTREERYLVILRSVGLVLQIYWLQKRKNHRHTILSFIAKQRKYESSKQTYEPTNKDMKTRMTLREV